MKSYKWQNLLIIAFAINLLAINASFAGTTSKLSNVFTLDTREVNPIPENGWQTLTYLGNTYNEDVIIDNFGKVWCFYYSSPGANQPVYMKIFKPNGYLYQQRQIVGFGSNETEPNFNTIRAALNDSTGDVWVALQGADGGYFVIYDSTGTIKQDSTLITFSAKLPKIAAGKNGNMWFTWHTDITYPQESQARIASYFANGQQNITPRSVSGQLGVINTDIAIDDSNRIWVVYEVFENGDFSTRLSVLKDDMTKVIDGDIISNNVVGLNSQRRIFSDIVNNRMWILENNEGSPGFNLHFYNLSGTRLQLIENIGQCTFTRNETNQMEVVRFNDSDTLNKTYEVAFFNAQTGELISTWQTLFDSTYQFVRNGIAYNRNNSSLKVYLVNKEQYLTKIKFEEVNPPYPVISVNSTSIDFDTTKIKETYKKPKIVTIQNSGLEILEVYRIYSTDTRFTAVDTSFQLKPGESKNVVLQFAPTDTNQVNGNMFIVSNDPNNQLVEIVVSGKGYNPTTAKIVVIPGSIIFDTVIIGNSQTKYIFIQNGDRYEPLVITSITSSDSQFTSSVSNLTVSPQSGEWVGVTFTPKTVGFIEGNLIIANNDPDTSNYVVPLIGEGREPNKPKIAVDPDSLNFGEVGINDTKQLYIEIWNNGEAPLSINNISTNDQQFTVSNTELTINANSSKLLYVNFSPTTEGLNRAWLTIISNDPDNSEIIIPLVGVGVLLSDPQLVYGQTELNFGKVAKGDSLRKGIIFQNYGDRTLLLYNITTTDTHFVVSSDTVYIEKLESYNLIVTFIPDDTVDYQGMLMVESNDPQKQVVEISLFGSGEKNIQQISVFPTALTFENVLVHTSSYKQLLVSNLGTDLLTISNIFSNNDKFKPSVTNFTLTQNQTREVLITFSPDSVKEYNGKIIIVSNDPVVDSLIVTVNGISRDSTDQNISVSTDSLDFGTVAKNNAKILSFVVSNKGERKLTVSDISSSDSVFKVNRTNFNIWGNTSESVYVTFTPTRIGEYRDSLEIKHDDPEKGSVKVYLTGIGREALPQKIELSATSLEFGSVPTDRSSSKSLWIYNKGERDLTVSRIAVSDEQFAVSDEWFLIKPGEAKYLYVTFTPTSATSVTATLTLVTNDPQNLIVTVELSGEGKLYTGPTISIYPQVLNFGNTIPGITKKAAVWVYNSSKDSVLRISGSELNNSSFHVTAYSKSISPGDSGTVQIAYQPVDEGYHSGTLTIFSNDEYNQQTNAWLYGYGVTENTGQNNLGSLGWNGNSSAPFGDVFSPADHTPEVLTNEEEQAWFIKDIYLYEYPNDNNTYMNLCFKNGITVIINNTLVFDSSATNVEYWNKQGLKVADFLMVGRNRVAVTVRTDNNAPLGGFDCELVVNGNAKIKRGDQNWNSDEALWWYYYNPGTKVPADTTQNRLWFSKDYALTGIDSVLADWVFEPIGSDTLYDTTPYGYRAILNNIGWIKGIVGQAMEFTGQENSYAQLDANLNNSPQTIEMWINCYGAQAHRQNVVSNIGSGEFGRGFFIDTDMTIGVYYYNGIFKVPDMTLSTNTWYNISVQYDYNSTTQYNSIYVYANNVLIGSTSFPFPKIYPAGSGNTCYLGGNPLGTTNTSFYGAIDEFKIKNTASGTPEIGNVASLTVASTDTLIKGTDYKLTFNIYPSPFKLYSGLIKYFHGGELAIGQDVVIDSSFVNPDSTYFSPLEITIPGDYIDIRGINYSIILETNYGTIYYPQQGHEEYEYAFLQVISQTELSNLSLVNKIHRMISVPFILKDNSVDAVLADDFGAYNPFRWRLFDWNQKDTTYFEYGDSTWVANDNRFTRGKAYWLITDGFETFDADNGMTPPNSEFLIDLKPGWNMIGNPFPYNVYWTSVSKSDFISDPITRKIIEVIEWDYNVSILEPWEGYFIWNSDSVNQSIIVSPLRPLTTPLNKKTAPSNHYQEKFPDLTILLSAELRCGKYADRYNLFGVSKRAENEYDKYDLPEAPVMGDYVSVWIDNRDWSSQKGAYTVDIRKSGEEGYSWNLVVDYSLTNPEQPLTLAIEKLMNLPDNWLIYLFDLSEDIAINLENQRQITIKPIKGKVERKYYKLVVGTKEFVNSNSDDIPLVPMKFELLQNYPNPFNSSTTITFSLPKRMHTKVKIYNIVGQLVKTLVDDELRGGLHKLIWDGRNNQNIVLSTGLYFVRIEGQNKVDVKKMLLIK